VLLLAACLVVVPTTTPITIAQQTQTSAAEQWRQLANASRFFDQMSLLQSLGQDSYERAAVRSRLHKMWETEDALRRPQIAYLMCQLGDRGGVEEVARAFFAGDYDVDRELEPDGDAAGANATDTAIRVLILYGTPQHHQGLLAFLKLSDDPLRRGGDLCEILLGLSSTKEGPGLPVGYPKEQFPLELAIACLGYTEDVGTIVSATGGTVHSEIGPRQGSIQEGSISISGVSGVFPQRGCDEAAQAIQNLTSRDFGHRVSDPISQRDKAIEAIKKWWTESHKGP
jgi:hypothetical protein